MQGTVVMLMALSGLGCHHKYDVAYGPPTYSAFFGMGCYANAYPNFMPSAYVPPSCYSPCYAGMYNGCYSACYGGCYGGGYVTKHHGCCSLLQALRLLRLWQVRLRRRPLCWLWLHRLRRSWALHGWSWALHGWSWALHGWSWPLHGWSWPLQLHGRPRARRSL